MFPHFTFSGTTYQALHRKLTLFCTCVTQIILLALSALCVFVAKKNIKQGNETAFLTETSSVISHLQEQDVIPHQWLNQLQENSSIQIYLYENGTHSFMTSIIRQLQTSNYVKMHFSPQKSLPGTLLFSRKIKGFPRIRNISSTPAITFPTSHPSAVSQKATAT